MPGQKSSHTKHINGRAKRLRPGQPAKCAKLDNRLEKRICVHVRAGLPYEACAALVGISKQTFYSWKNRGDSEPDSRYGQFARAVENANAQAIRSLHTAVRVANPQWILERRFPNYYGPPKLRTETEISGPGGSPIPIDSAAKFTVIVNCPMSDADLQKLMPIVDGTTGLPVPDSENP